MRMRSVTLVLIDWCADEISHSLVSIDWCADEISHFLVPIGWCADEISHSLVSTVSTASLQGRIKKSKKTRNPCREAVMREQVLEDLLVVLNGEIGERPSSDLVLTQTYST